MRRVKDQTGSTLIMVICVGAALFVMSATLVMVTANTQGRTLATRSKDKSLNVAEAAMESTVYSLGNSWPTESTPSPTPSPFSYDPSAVNSWYANAPSGEYTGMTSTAYLKPYWTVDSNNNPVLDTTKYWVVAQGTVAGQKSAIQCVVQQHSTGVTTVVPGVALYAGGNVTMTGSTQVGPSSAAALMSPGTVNVSGDGLASFPATIQAGTLTKSGWQTFANSGTPTSTLTQLWPASTTSSLTATAQTALQYANGGGGALLVSNSSKSPDFATTGLTGFVGSNWGGNWTTPCYSTGDLHVNTQGKYVFQSLYVNGNLTVDGASTFDCANLYVTGSLTIGGGAATDNLKNVYVGGDVNFSGSHTFDIALLVTGGNFTDGGSQNVGDSTTPCMLIQTGTNKTTNISGYCPFTGVVANMGGGAVNLSGSVLFDGAMFTAGTVNMSGSGGITYDANIINKFTTVQQTAATLIPDTWEEITPS